MYFLVKAEICKVYVNSGEDFRCFDDMALVVADTKEEAEQKYTDHITSKSEENVVEYEVWKCTVLDTIA